MSQRSVRSMSSAAARGAFLVLAAMGVVVAGSGSLRADTAAPVAPPRAVSTAPVAPIGSQLTVSPTSAVVTMSSTGVLTGDTQTTVTVSYNSGPSCVKARFLNVSASYGGVAAGQSSVMTPGGMQMGSAKFPTATNTTGVCSFTAAQGTFTQQVITNAWYSRVCAGNVGKTLSTSINITYEISPPNAQDAVIAGGPVLGSGRASEPVQIKCVQ
jgi:hypothetical protein